MKRNDYNSQLYQETLGPMLLLLKYYLDFCTFVYSLSQQKVPYGSRGVGANKSTCETTVSLWTSFPAIPGALQVETLAWRQLEFAEGFSWFQLRCLGGHLTH